MRTTTFKKRTLIAYEVDESSRALVVNVLGVFHGGRDWEAASATNDPRRSLTFGQMQRPPTVER